MDVGGDPLTEAMRDVYVGGNEKHGNDWLDHSTVRAWWKARIQYPVTGMD
jgi:hypothetical protein